MPTETKKIALIVAFLSALLMPLVFAHAAPLGLPCGKEAGTYVEQYNEQLSRAETDQEREELRRQFLEAYKSDACKLQDLFTGAAKVTNYLIGAIGIFVVFRLVIAGFQMVVMSGNEKSVKSARSAMSNAVIGLIIVFLSFAIINTIFSVFAVRVGVQQRFTFPYNPFNQVN